MFNIVRNQRGMSLIEVLVSGAMTIIISLGVATMMQNSFKEQRRVVLLDTLRNQKTKIETMIRDQSIWNATMTGNAAIPLFANLRAGTAATAIPLATPIKMQIFNGDGSLAMDLLGPASTSGNGFSEKGAACSTFNAAANSGNDDCPFSYRMLVAAVCPTGAATCTNPQLKIVARLVFNPSANGPLANFGNLVSPVAGSSIADTIQDNKYDAVVKRTSTAVNRSFRIVSGFTPAAGSTCAAAGAGTCTVARNPHPRTLLGAGSGQWSESLGGAFDTYDLVDAVSSTVGAFRFKETGYYGCLISVPAFATQGFEAYLTAGGTPLASSAITAGLWVQATAVIDAKFNVTNISTDYRIEQKCDALPAAVPAGTADNCTLGFGPASTYGTFLSIVTVSCYKMDRSL